jgi:hypothetical protein
LPFPEPEKRRESKYQDQDEVADRRPTVDPPEPAGQGVRHEWIQSGCRLDRGEAAAGALMRVSL